MYSLEICTGSNKPNPNRQRNVHWVEARLLLVYERRWPKMTDKKPAWYMAAMCDCRREGEAAVCSGLAISISVYF